MSPEDYRQKFNEEDAVGWQCIDRHLEASYGVQKERHYAPALRWRLGGDNLLDGCSIYDHPGHPEGVAFHRHIVSYGMSELYYDEKSAGQPFSGWGFEFTFRVVPFAGDAEFKGQAHKPRWVMALMNNLARYVFSKGNWFEAYHFTPANGPVRLDTETAITALAFVSDPELGTLATPHGEVAFVQMVGLTDSEYLWLKEAGTTERTQKLMARMRQDNPWLLTDLTRRVSWV
jgi:hypothetical protein